MFKAASKGTAKVITCNRLKDGLVAFLTADGGWSLDIADARVLDDGPELEEAEAYAVSQHDDRVVIDPYPIDVEIAEGVAPVPTRLRERIRAERGPTIAYGEAERRQIAQGA